MRRTLLPLLFILLNYSEWTSGLCILENGTVARCNELEDVKYIETYDLESLKAPVERSILHPGLFVNLTSLRHLDLSGGDIEQIEPGTFSKLTNLRSLSLAENRIEHLELGFADGLNRLHSLNLRKNNFRQLPPALARLKALRHLVVQGNPMQCNCATLRVRDLIAKRGVKVSKRILCVGPNSAKGTSLFKPDTSIVCSFEEQDREMQNDQAFKDSEEDYGSGDLFDKEEDESGEYVVVISGTSEAPKEMEIETPFPGVSEASTTASALESETTESSQASTSAAEETLASTETRDLVKNKTDRDDEIFFDSEEKKGSMSTIAGITEKKKVYKDALFYPVEGSGDEDEGSGEGSGTGMIFGDWKKIGEVERTNEKEDESSSNNGLFDLFLNVFWSTTEASNVKEDLDLKEEQFIDATSTKEAEEDVIVLKKIDFDEAQLPSSTEETTTKIGTTDSVTNGVELVNTELHDMTKLGKVKADDENANDELTGASPAKQSKKGMGSYVVLAALLAILATLIGFAAYKGDFCRKKRKRGDVENGTELKDMQKALLETGNSTQPKVASNGNVENAPLVEDATNHEEIKVSDNREITAEIPKLPNDTASDRTEPVKPPRTVISQNDQRARETTAVDGSSLKDDSRTSSMDPMTSNSPITRLPEINRPPLSPGAQRVKITLQENPDSVPRTPILITRTMAGENLVKTP